MPQFDFANVLFAGPCNRTCPFCIGKQIPESVNTNNLDTFPPKNWQAFCGKIKELGITELIFTGTTTDPQLYQHEQALIGKARADLPGIKISVHTNGVLATKKIEIFNAYDRATISLPSLSEKTYRRMMGHGQVPDLARLVAEAKIPIKI
ncbi:MAG TPA: radical SAM protein, partial [Turneriella sp.]|nr:radical SAM protein [Turneriella sp.]